MSTETLSLSAVLPATPQQVYDAWLDTSAHFAMTGGHAEIEPRVGGKQRAWDGYIDGEFLDLLPGLRIALAWRTRDFPDDAPSSRVEVTLAPVEGGTRITVAHTGIPEGQAGRYETGWQQFYFAPMRRYFERSAHPGIARAPARMRSRPPPRPSRARTPRAATKKRPPKRAAKSPAKRSAAAKKRPPKRTAASSAKRSPARPQKRRSKARPKSPARKRAPTKRVSKRASKKRK